ncbi:MAG: hypothetical protein RBQ99_05700 [Trichlorobacter sp.]|jgi:hypothetical protein|nr:hypothetical protein [Trichlorobacter sp.]
MTKIAKVVLGAMLVASLSVTSVFAADGRTVGPIQKIEMAADQKSAIVTVKDNKSGKDVVIKVTDDETLAKFKDKRIVVEDEIRSKFEITDDGNNSKLFRKTGGC